MQLTSESVLGAGGVCCRAWPDQREFRTRAQSKPGPTTGGSGTWLGQGGVVTRCGCIPRGDVDEEKLSHTKSVYQTHCNLWTIAIGKTIIDFD